MLEKASQILNLDLQSLKGEEPKAFSSRVAAAEFAKRFQERGEIASLEREYLERASEVLSHPALSTLIKRNEVTFAMIKPNANEAKAMDIDVSLPTPIQDEEAADILRHEITQETQYGMGEIILDISVQFTPEQAEVFYSHLPSEIRERVKNHMSSGPTTVLLLRHLVRDGRARRRDIRRVKFDAREWWRGKIGRTNPVEASHNTIRGKFARRISNNLVHGSDSEESALKEVDFLRRVLGNFIENRDLDQ